LYESTGVENSEPLVGFSTVYLQVGEVTFPNEANWTICVSKSGFERCFPLDSSRIRSFTISLPSLDRYFFNGSCRFGNSSLLWVTGESLVDVNSPQNYITRIQFRLLETRTPLTQTSTKSPFPTPSIFIAAECKSVDVASEPYHQLKVTHQNITRSPGYYCETHYLECLTIDSATLYLELHHQAYPFNEYSLCFSKAESFNFFSIDISQSRFCTVEEFSHIMADWKNDDSSSGHSISPGAIAGISIGAVVLAVLVGLGIFCPVKKYRRPRLYGARLTHPSDAHSPPGDDRWLE
jgi:hypothetical protein